MAQSNTSDTLRRNIGRLCKSFDGDLYIITGIHVNKWTAPKYIVQNVKTGNEILLYPDITVNHNFLKWLTEPLDLV
jgi:hypothetical protein